MYVHVVSSRLEHLFTSYHSTVGKITASHPHKNRNRVPPHESLVSTTGHLAGGHHPHWIVGHPTLDRESHFRRNRPRGWCSQPKNRPNLCESSPWSLIFPHLQASTSNKRGSLFTSRLKHAGGTSEQSLTGKYYSLGGRSIPVFFLLYMS
jgi:hypothetical protein